MGTDRWRAAIALALSLVSGTLACGPGLETRELSTRQGACEGGACAPEIDCSREACPADKTCARIGDEARCFAPCAEVGSACGAGGVCTKTSATQAVCVIGTTPLGSPCGPGLGTCAGGALCASLHGGQAICVRPCEEPGGLCDDGSVCVGDERAAICAPGGAIAEGGTCEEPGSCVAGARCVGVPGSRRCVRACEGDRACRDAMACVALGAGGGKVCRPRIGAACVSGGDCGAGLACSSEVGDGRSRALRANVWPGGYCAPTGCSGDAACPAGSVCRALGEGPATCVAKCASEADCRFFDGWSCLEAQACGGEPGCEAYFGEARLCARSDRLQSLARSE